MIKICVVNQSFEPGGSSNVADNLANYFATKSDFDVSIISFFDAYSPKYASLSNPKIKKYFLNKKKTIDLKFEKKLKKTLKLINPDVISTHLTCVAYINKYIDYNKTKVFHTIHTFPSVDLPKIYRLMIKRNVKKENIKLIGCCQAISEEASKLYGVNVKTIRNGINDDVKESNQEHKFDFLCVGRFSPEKCFLDCLAAFSKVLKTHPNSKMALCGYGAEKSKIECYIANNNLSDSVTLFDENYDVNKLYATSKVFILFSSREASPITILEAMKYGMPVIASDVGGVSEIVKDGVSGFLTKPHNIDLHVRYMNKLLDDHDIYDFMRNNALLLFKEHTTDVMCYKYLKHMIEDL